MFKKPADLDLHFAKTGHVVFSKRRVKAGIDKYNGV